MTMTASFIAHDMLRTIARKARWAVSDLESVIESTTFEDARYHLANAIVNAAAAEALASSIVVVGYEDAEICDGLIQSVSLRASLVRGELVAVNAYPKTLRQMKVSARAAIAGVQSLVGMIVDHRVSQAFAATA